MDGYELYNELNYKTKLLDTAVRELKSRGIAYAQAERDYRVKKAEAILEERAKGTPATITLDIVKGRKDVSKLCFERDCAETMWKSALEAINAIKLQLRLLESQVQREWGQAQGV